MKTIFIVTIFVMLALGFIAWFLYTIFGRIKDWKRYKKELKEFEKNLTK